MPDTGSERFQLLYRDLFGIARVILLPRVRRQPLSRTQTALCTVYTQPRKRFTTAGAGAGTGDRCGRAGAHGSKGHAHLTGVQCQAEGAILRARKWGRQSRPRERNAENLLR